MKDEHYDEYKHARGIYAREDNAKLYFGPWFKMMEHELYKVDDNGDPINPEFIKHVPVAKRAGYIFKRLFSEGACYIQTDYSSFEAHFDKFMQQAVEFVLYDFMLQYVPGGKEVLSIMKEVLSGKNIVKNKFISAIIYAHRMSGEMCTSLGNGFSNLMFMNYVTVHLSKRYGKKIELRGVVEGDDGLFAFFGIAPMTHHFDEMGLIIKLVKFDELSKAGFCGQLFDIEDLQIITDPYRAVASLGWTTSRYTYSKNRKLMMLLRCKALSLAHQYPGCPIIGALAQYALRVTKSIDVKGFIERRSDLNLYEYEKLKEAIGDKSARLYVEPGVQTRLLFSELYGISLEDQRTIENYFDNLDHLQPLDVPIMRDEFKIDWIHYYDNYCLNLDIKILEQGNYHLDVGRYRRKKIIPK